MPKIEGAEAAKMAAKAHTDLNVFAAVVCILEGGNIYLPESKAAAAKIIRLCHAEQRKRLRDYDAAVAAASN